MIDVVSQKNGEVASLIKKQNDLVTLQKEDKKAFDMAVETHRKAAELANADLDKVSKQAAEDKNTLTVALTEAQSKIDEQGKEAEKIRRTLTEKITTLQTSIGALETKVIEQAQAIRDLQPDDFDVAQGRITLSDPTSKLFGSTLARTTTFVHSSRLPFTERTSPSFCRRTKKLIFKLSASLSHTWQPLVLFPPA